MDTGTQIKTLELDKICRVCLTVKKDMRPLFGEMIADLLMECACIQVDKTDGWPDKICIQCVHQVSRCHAFKSRVEKSDQQLRQYIKGITVIVEEPITQIELQSNEVSTHHHQPHHIQVTQAQHTQTQQQSQQQQQRQEIQLTRNDLTTHATEIQPQQMIINGQLHNAQIINAGQIVTTAPHLNQAMIQTTTVAAQQQHQQQQQQLQQQQQQQIQAPPNVQLCQLVQTGNGQTAVQMIPQNGQPTQLVQIQRSIVNDDRCEIIVQQDMGNETQYYTEDDLKNLVNVTTQAMNQEEIQDDNVQLIEEIEEIEEEEEEEVEGETIFTLDITDDEECEDKEYLAEFISMQTSCPYPGRFICNLCRKEFKQSQYLNNHMKSHSNWIKANCKKQPQCHICQRSFKGPGMLKMHMKTHEQKQPEKPPKCKVCDKEFKSKTILYRHRQTHLQKNFQCGVCHKSFSTISVLQTHQSKTNHEKTFKCAHCSKTYTNGNELKVHLQQHGIKTLQQLKIEVLE